jgi:hypothetical protein
VFGSAFGAEFGSGSGFDFGSGSESRFGLLGMDLRVLVDLRSWLWLLGVVETVWVEKGSLVGLEEG